MSPSIKSIVKSLNAKVRANAPARLRFSESERSAASILYAATIGEMVEQKALAEAQLILPVTVAKPITIPERLRVTDEMDACEAGARYSELAEWSRLRG